jgi:hypothetical protein
MALRRSVLQDDILCELYVDTRSDVSDNSDNESLDINSDVPTTSSRKQLQSSTGPLIPQFPHPFFFTYVKTILTCVCLSARLFRVTLRTACNIRDVTPGTLTATDTCIVYHVTRFEASRNVILHTRYVSTYFYRNRISCKAKKGRIR